MQLHVFLFLFFLYPDLVIIVGFGTFILSLFYVYDVYHLHRFVPGEPLAKGPDSEPVKQNPQKSNIAAIKVCFKK